MGSRTCLKSDNSGCGFGLGRVLAVFAAVFLIFQPVYQQVLMGGSHKVTVLCSSVAGKSTVTTQRDGEPGQIPTGPMQTCGHCLVCAGGALGLFIVSASLLLLGLIAQQLTPDRLQDQIPLGRYFRSRLQARAPPKN